MREIFRFVENKSQNKSFSYIVCDKIESFLHKMGSSRLFQIYYILEGEGAFVQLDKKKNLCKGDLLIVNPFEESGFETKSGNCMTFIGIGVERIECQTIGKHDHATVLKEDGAFTNCIINHIYELMCSGEEMLANQYFDVFLKELDKTLSLKKATVSLTKEEAFARKIKNYLDNNLLEKISIQSLADHFYCSPSSLFHTFKKIEGVTIIEYLQDKRLELAKHFLRTGNRKIADICIDVGFSSTQFFYSYFLKKEKVTPNEYRRLHKN